jgi:hypothetical protein
MDQQGPKVGVLETCELELFYKKKEFLQRLQ